MSYWWVCFHLAIISSSSQRKFINDYFSLFTYLISIGLRKKNKRIKKVLSVDKTFLSERPGSNWRHSAWKADALPTELLSLIDATNINSFLV